MRDFPFWREAIRNAKTPLALRAIGEELATFQGQQTFLGDEEKRLTDGQVAQLRTLYSARAKKLEAEKI